MARAIDADANGLKALATAIVAKPGHLVVLVSSSTPALAVVARSADVSLPAQRLLASLIPSSVGAAVESRSSRKAAGSPDHRGGPRSRARGTLSSAIHFSCGGDEERHDDRLRSRR